MSFERQVTQKRPDSTANDSHENRKHAVNVSSCDALTIISTLTTSACGVDDFECAKPLNAAIVKEHHFESSWSNYIEYLQVTTFAAAFDRRWNPFITQHKQSFAKK